MSSSPKATPKADVAKDAAVSQGIGADVDSAVHNFRDLEAKLKVLLESCKDQHNAILHLSEKRLQLASTFQSFAAGTPLRQIAGAVNVEDVSASLFKKEQDENDDSHEPKEERHPGDENREETSSEKPEKEKPAEHTDETEEMKQISIGTPLETAPAEFFDIDNSFVSVHQTSYKLSEMYIDQYYEQAIQYVEDWQKVISDRVNSRLMEFESHEEKLSHYREKVEKLDAYAEKLMSKSKTLSKRQSEKMERNKLKLNGVREAHDSYGESLFLFLDEVTERAWKDIFPLLLRALEFDIDYSRDQAKVFVKLTKTVSALKTIGEKEGLSPNGRLDDLKAKKPEELYTGEQDVVQPVSKSPIKHEDSSSDEESDEEKDAGDDEHGTEEGKVATSPFDEGSVSETPDIPESPAGSPVSV